MGRTIQSKRRQRAALVAGVGLGPPPRGGASKNGNS